jgi:hypothetical protein
MQVPSKNYTQQYGPTGAIHMMWQSRFTSILWLLLLLAFLSRVELSAAQADNDPGQVVGEFLLLLLGTDEGKQEALDFVGDQRLSVSLEQLNV